MSILGSVSSLYMAILIILLIVGFGLVGLKLINYVLDLQKDNSSIKKKNVGIENYENIIKCLKISLFSFFAIVISMIILGMVDSQVSTVNMQPIIQDKTQHQHNH